MAGEWSGRHETAHVGQMDISGEDVHFRRVAAYSAHGARSKTVYVMRKNGASDKNADDNHGAHEQFYRFPVAGHKHDTFLDEYPDRYPPKYNEYARAHLYCEFSRHSILSPFIFMVIILIHQG